MDGYQKAKNDLEDKLSAQNQLIHTILQQQAKANDNVKSLKENFTQLDGIIKNLKEGDRNIVVRPNEGGPYKKASDVLKMNFEQILNNQSMLYNTAAFKNSLMFVEQLEESAVFPKSTRESYQESLKSTNNDLDDENIEIDEEFVLIDKLEVLLVEQKLDEAVQEYKRLLELQRNCITFKGYIKRKKFEKIIVDELKAGSSYVKINSVQPDFRRIDRVIETLMDLSQPYEAIEVALNYVTRCLNFSKFPLDMKGRIETFFVIISQTLEYLANSFGSFLIYKEYSVFFSNWAIKEFRSTIKAIMEGQGPKANKEEKIEELKFLCSDYGLKGLDLEFVIDEFALS